VRRPAAFAASFARHPAGAPRSATPPAEPLVGYLARSCVLLYLIIQLAARTPGRDAGTPLFAGCPPSGAELRLGLAKASPRLRPTRGTLITGHDPEVRPSKPQAEPKTSIRLCPLPSRLVGGSGRAKIGSCRRTTRQSIPDVQRGHYFDTHRAPINARNRCILAQIDSSGSVSSKPV
jgi:hypothetical protein